MLLHDKIKSVEDALITLIKDNLPVDLVNGIVFNREVRDGDIKPPYLHVFMDPCPIESIGGAGTEYWHFRFTVMVVAPSYKSEDADEARQICLVVSTIIMQDRQVGETTKDVIRLTYHADYTRELPSEQLFGAAVEMEARFQFREV